MPQLGEGFLRTNQHFGNAKARNYLTLAGGDLVDQIRSGGKGLSPEYRQAITEGNKIGAEKRFFHWDLEFPEAFVDLERSTWKPREDQGFDAVVGNPPYDVLATKEIGHDSSHDLGYFKTTSEYMPAVRGKINLYELFICRAIALANLHGALSLITPMALLGDNQTRGIRHRILTGKEIRTIESFPQKDDIRRRVFPEAKLSTAVFVVKGECSGQAFAVRTHPGRLIETQSQALQIRPDQISAYDPDNIAIPSCTQRDWDIAMKILGNDVIRMSMIADHNQGEVNETTHSRFLFAEGDGPTVLRGAAISMYAVREASQGLHLFSMLRVS